MQVKVYVPKIIEIPSEFLPALAKRAADSLGDKAHEVSATRGHWCGRRSRTGCCETWTI